MTIIRQIKRKIRGTPLILRDPTGSWALVVQREVTGNTQINSPEVTDTGGLNNGSLRDHESSPADGDPKGIISHDHEGSSRITRIGIVRNDSEEIIRDVSLGH
jgi:hypothetical protein